MKEINYRFVYVDHCNMCGSKTDHQKIIGKRLNQSQGRRPKRKIGITTTVCKCKTCGLIYSNPQPIPTDIQDHYGVPPEDYWNDDYFKTNPKYFKGALRQLKSLIQVQPGMKSLDIGAGVGKVMTILREQGFETYGLEPSETFYKRAISQMGISQDKLKLSMIEDADYPPDFFDFISFGVVLEHLYDPSSAIKKAIKWLKPNGVIHIEVPSSDWLINKMINLYYKVSGLDYVGHLSPMHEPYHLYEFSLQSFKSHAKQNNYEIAFHEYFVCQTFMPKAFDYFLKPYMRRTNKGMQLCVWLKKTD